MDMRKATLALLLSVLLIPVAAGTALAQTADDVVNKHLAALGGREALSKLTTRHATGTITITTPVGDLGGPADLVMKAPNKAHSSMDIDLTALGAGTMHIEQIFDGKNGYVLNSMQGDTDMPARQVENARNNMFPTMLLSYKEAGITLEMLPASKIDGRGVIGLKATPKVGAPFQLYFDAETYLLSRTVIMVDAPDGSTLEQTSDSSDYRAVDGVKVAFTVVNTNAQQTVTIKLAKVEHNVPIADAVFVKK
jgi:outer membrane lipoprotein-sorting protein